MLMVLEERVVMLVEMIVVIVAVEPASGNDGSWI